MIKQLLKTAYGILPILAGADKFTNLLTNWEHYFPPVLTGLVPVELSLFMKLLGIFEIAAGLIVFIKTKAGAYILAGYFTLIAVVLLFNLQYFDIAIRDLMMAIGAFTLGKIYGVPEE